MVYTPHTVYPTIQDQPCSGVCTWCDVGVYTGTQKGLRRGLRRGSDAQIPGSQTHLQKRLCLRPTRARVVYISPPATGSDIGVRSGVGKGQEEGGRSRGIQGVGICTGNASAVHHHIPPPTPRRYCIHPSYRVGVCIHALHSECILCVGDPIMVPRC